jgi:hypothetical protein
MESADGKGIRKILDDTLDAFKKAHGERSVILPVPLRQAFGRQSDDKKRAASASMSWFIWSGSGEKLTVRRGR